MKFGCPLQSVKKLPELLVMVSVLSDGLQCDNDDDVLEQGRRTGQVFSSITEDGGGKVT